MAITLQTTEYNVIYVLSKGDINGALKIGKTSVHSYDVESLTPNCKELIEATEKRLKDLGTYGVTDIKIEYTEVAWFENSKGQKMAFWDHDVHDVLTNSQYKKRVINSSYGNADEWFEVDVETAKKAIKAVKEEKEKIDGPVVIGKKRVEIVFRTEQDKAIQDTVTHFNNDGEKMLWNAKMRFGKTLCALELIRQMGFKRTLILTHRPTVRKGWFEDYHLIKFQNYEYGSKDGDKFASLDEDDVKGKDFATLQNHLSSGEISGYVYFASMQDLRGSKKVSKKGIDKNNEVFKNEWDFIILDEAHEGTQTELGKNVVNELTENNNPKLLYLSGTPYNILSQFEDKEIYTWDYVMEQTAKENWEKEHPDEKNPYAGLARMNIYTYHLGDVFEVNNYMQSDDDFFNFAEFFRVWSEENSKEMPSTAKVGDFVHEDDVKKFLDLLCEESPESNYPFSCDEFRRALSHTLWMVPGVAQAQALEAMILKHPLHTKMGYYIVNVAGEGSKIASSDPDDIKIDKLAKDALTKVELAIRGKAEEQLEPHQKTITLSCGRLTTGVSVPEWTGVFMLSGGYNSGAANFMQTIFRCQTPFKNGAIKSNCYAFDFAPDRTLTVIDDWVAMTPIGQHGSGSSSSGSHNQKVASLLRFCPVIAMNGSSETKYDAISFVQRVNDAYTEFIVKNGFKGKKLVKDFASFNESDYELLEKIGKLIGGGKVKTGTNGEIVLTGAGLTGKAWTCEKCGAKGQTGLTCEVCGAKAPQKPPKPQTWKCNKCNHEGNTGATCDKCGEPKPVKPSKGWNCPNCGHSGNHGDVCDNCNAPKPKTSKQESDRRRKAQNVLDQIFVRLPLLLFGAVEDATSLTIDELISNQVIDDKSWEEFMPKGFTKPMMKQIGHLIRIDRLIASATRTIDEAKQADGLPIEQRIVAMAKMISRFHFPDKETVLTPWRVVNMHMTDTLGGYDFYDEKHEQLLDELRLVEKEGITDAVFLDSDTKILEINSKSGVYPLWLACTLWKLQRNPDMSPEEDWDLWKSVLERNLFVVCKTRMAEKITRRVLVGYRTDLHVNTVSFNNLIDRIKDKEKQKKLIQEIKNPVTYNNKIYNGMLEFKAIVGNPPYQITVAKKKTANGQKRVSSIFHYFQIAADQLKPTYTSLIYPAGRWIHRSGKGLAEFGKKQINDLHLCLIEFFPDSNYIFNQADIADGISIVMKDFNKNTKGFYYRYGLDAPIFMQNPGDKLMPLNPKHDSIVNEIDTVVKQNDYGYLNDSVLSQKLFGIESEFVEENPTLVREYNLGDKFDPKHEIKLFTNDKKGKAGRARWYIANRDVITSGTEYLDKWKVIVSSANAGGQKRSNQMAVVDNHSAFGRSRVALKTFDTEKEARNFYAYAQSELIRFAFLLTDEALTSLGKWVPDILDYSDDNGIIDFNKDINEQLYKLFNIDDDMQKHIKSVLAAKE